jgi:hypothetical protein
VPIYPSYPDPIVGDVFGTGSSGVLEISSIPSAFRSLEIHLIGRSDTAATNATVRLTFETTPTVGSYNHQALVAFATTVVALENIGTSDYITTAAFPAASSSSPDLIGFARILLPDYSNAGFKNVLINTVEPTNLATGGMITRQMAGCWESTGAIDRVRMTLSAGNWTADSRMTIYGKPA